MSSLLIRLISSGGILAIFVTMAAESAGIPISSEIVVPLGGALASQGSLPFAAVVVAATLGNLVGSLVAFWLTQRYGRAVILGPGRRLGFSEGHLRLAERFFERFGSIAVFVGRLLPVVRTYISFPAGLSRMGVTRFATLTLLAPSRGTSALPTLATAWAATTRPSSTRWGPSRFRSRCWCFSCWSWSTSGAVAGWSENQPRSTTRRSEAGFPVSPPRVGPRVGGETPTTRSYRSTKAKPAPGQS